MTSADSLFAVEGRGTHTNREEWEPEDMLRTATCMQHSRDEGRDVSR